MTFGAIALGMKRRAIGITKIGRLNGRSRIQHASGGSLLKAAQRGERGRANPREGAVPTDTDVAPRRVRRGRSTREAG
jgi:hypothetical protein